MPANLDAIRRAFCDGTWDFNAHGAIKALKHGIREEDIRSAICNDAPELLEDYAEDIRGPACLVLGWIDPARPLHIEVGYGNDPSYWMDVITVYDPEPEEWYNYRVRRK